MTIRVAVVGVGALGQHHARILSNLDGVKLVAVAEPREARGREIANKFACGWVADYRDLIGEIDAVSIVVPTIAHLDVASDFLRAGIPVLVEKPLADTLDAAQDLVARSERTDTLLQVGHVERFNPAFRAAQAYLRSPRYLRAERTSTFTFRSTDIGVVHDLMIHDLDLILSLVRSEVASVEAIGVAVMSGLDDAVQARLTFENGTIADLTASRISPVAKRSLQAWTADGCLTADLQSREVLFYAPSAELRAGPSPVTLAQQPGADLEQLKKDVFGRFIDVKTIPVSPGDALTDELSSFLECVRSGGRPLVGRAESLAAMTIAHEISAQVRRRNRLPRRDAA